MPDSINAQEDMGGVLEVSIDPGRRDPMVNHRHGTGLGGDETKTGSKGRRRRRRSLGRQHVSWETQRGAVEEVRR